MEFFLHEIAEKSTLVDFSRNEYRKKLLRKMCQVWELKIILDLKNWLTELLQNKFWISWFLRAKQTKSLIFLTCWKQLSENPWEWMCGNSTVTKWCTNQFDHSKNFPKKSKCILDTSQFVSLVFPTKMTDITMTAATED